MVPMKLALLIVPSINKALRFPPTLVGSVTVPVNVKVARLVRGSDVKEAEPVKVKRAGASG
jgi:hypothetical protein